MSVIREIAAWANGQADWMSDAVRRLFAQGTLSQPDIEDIAALMKAHVGIPDPKDRTPQRLHQDHIPEAGQPGVDVSLTGLRNPTNLNAIGFPDGLTFEPVGLTVIYGYNGSGKSGYARALKKACRARNSEAIVPNVFAPPKPAKPASAHFEWVAAGAEASADWQDGGPAPAALSKIAVFDSHCARVLVDDTAEIAYIPYGMDVLRELAAAQAGAQRLLENERAAGKFDTKRLDSLAGNTVVGRLIANLSRNTMPADVQAFATLAQEELDEMAMLDNLLRKEDPAKQALVLRHLAARVQAVEAELARLAQPFSEEHIGKLRLAFEQLSAAYAASQLAAIALKEGALPGTGTEPWEVLVRSAIAFATDKAYPGHPFPGPEEGASCVLCQQPLSTEATRRLQDFVKFLEADTQRRHDDCRTAAADLYRPIKNAELAVFPADKALLEELREKVPDVVASIKAFVAALVNRQDAVKKMAPNRRLDPLAQLPTNPCSALKEFSNKLLAGAGNLDKTLTPEERAVKTSRLNDLEARVKLKPLVGTVVEAIAAAQRDYLLGEALKCCNPRAVTQKTGELYERTVTADLRAALEREFKALELTSMKVSLETSGQRGARMQQLRHAGAPEYSKVKLSGILSEGEQRAIAVASFLAEIGLEQGKSGIIFDDPVCSLDHIRREKIARRVAAEAKTRQVIVFTHDLAFAWELLEWAKKHNSARAVRYVFSAGSSKGHCATTLPFEAQKLESRINALKDVCSRAKKKLEVEHNFDDYNELVRNGYRKLRDSWELLVEDHLFARTVKRFRRSVDTQQLRYVTVEDSDAKAVYDGMSRSSYFTHEGGDEAPPSLPGPDEFLSDIEALSTLYTAISARKKTTEKLRAEAGVPS